jgi:glycosyltransferase involved in cell wall biosynthesis
LGIAKNVNKPDVIIGSSVHPFAVIAAWWLARRYKARFIFEVRDLWPQTPVDMGIMKPNSVMAKFLYIWEKFMYKKAEKIITLLPNAKDYITKLGIDLDKIVCIPNGVNLKNYDNYLENIEVPEIDSFIKKNDKKFKIIYAGAHGPANGLDVVINAAEILEKEDPDVHFLMAGDGVDKNRIIENAKKIKITNITFLDSVKKSQVPIVLKSADLLLHCLKDLNVFKHGISPNKLNDYMASAKPIIMSVKASNDIVEEANAGLTVEPENPKALVEAIIKIKNMTPEERKEMGENGRRYVEKFHSIKVLADKLEAII